MSIRLRLFAGTAGLVLILIVVQVWLQARQLEAVESEIASVATTVGRGLMFEGVGRELGEGLLRLDTDVVWVENGVDPTPATDRDSARVEADAAASPAPDTERQELRRRLEVKVIQRERGERMLVVREDGAVRTEVPIPLSPTRQLFRDMHRQSVLVGIGLLLSGLGAAAVLADRMTRPLRAVGTAAERLGAGESGISVPVTSRGEVGDLQTAFNRMSRRLGELEEERRAWREREHLAQLGDVSRGLAHTLRNPLNTLGLAVEELARDDRDAHLVATVRAQIRRVDRWLRSFLTLAAGRGAKAEPADLGDVVDGVVLEAVQRGEHVELVRNAGDDLRTTLIPAAVGAAVANLLDNAAEAAPGEIVEVTVERSGEWGRVTVADRGPGLPEEVRRKLFSPHVTTKTDGSGMGLFLAYQLVVVLHGGRLEVEDRPTGGTRVRLDLPLEWRDG